MTTPKNIAVTVASSVAVDALRAGRDYTHLVAKAEALFLGWVEAFEPILQEHEVLFVEREFTFPLLNPETGGTSRTFLEAGKIDAGLRHRRSGQVKVLEHKTTADSIAPESPYWWQLTMDSQISKYILALRQQGMETMSVLYDVVRKPAQRPSAIPLLDEDGVKIVHDGSGARVRTKDGKKWRESGDSALGYVLQTREETPEEYRDRVLGVLRADRFGYFSQREIPRLDSDLLEYMGDAWALSQEILYRRKANLWPRNPKACTAFGTCAFFALCTGRASVDDIQFTSRERVHPELETQPAELEFLTNSRLTALRKCSRFHFLTYEQPTEPVGEPDEALAVGTLFHRGAEVFLKQHLNPHN